MVRRMTAPRLNQFWRCRGFEKAQHSCRTISTIVVLPSSETSDHRWITPSNSETGPRGLPVPATSGKRARERRQSSDEGRTSRGPIAATMESQPDGWTEEFDVAELESGDLLCVFGRAADAHRWQALLTKSGDTWTAGEAAPSTLPHSGHPELLATREGARLGNSPPSAVSICHH